MIGRNVKIIDCDEWDQLVRKTYGKPYCFQQQDGCKQRGVSRLNVPAEPAEFYTNDSVPEIINGDEMGVSLSAWLARDPQQPVGDRTQQWEIDLWWHRNFYPCVQEVANDLHSKGLLEADSYLILIDW